MAAPAELHQTIRRFIIALLRAARSRTSLPQTGALRVAA
jgi:hypothetical protein